MNRMIEWFIRNPVAANLLMFVMIFAGGWVTLPNLKQEEFPPIEPEAVSIVVEYRGASPAEVEESICIRIEEAIDGTPDVDRIVTMASEGVCRVTAEVRIGADVDAATTEIENRINAIDTFPIEAERPSVAKAQVRRAVLKVALFGPIDERDLKRLGQRARDEITSLAGVSQAELRYDRPFEISIEVSEQTLRRYGINLESVAQAVRASSLDLPGGSIKTGGGEILLRSKGQAYNRTDFEDIVVLTRNDGTIVRLGEIAEVLDGFEDTELRGRFNGDPSVMIKVSLVGEEDALVAAQAIKDWIGPFQNTLPEGVSATIFADESLELVVRLAVLVRNGVSGMLLVFVVLALFLRFRLAMWVAAGVPIAFTGALMLFPILGLTINTMTVMAFILVLGILVDDAIVIGESIHTAETTGLDQVDAAVKGSQTVFTPVVFGVLTSIAAFIPIMIVPGRMGSFFGTIAIGSIACLVFSLVESLLILPAHLAHRRVSVSRENPNKFSSAWRKFQGSLSDGLERLAQVHYGGVLDRAIEWRYAAVAIAVGVLILTLGLGLSGRLRYQFFPQVAGDVAYASLTMPRGIPLERTVAAVSQLQDAADQLKEEIDSKTPGPSIFLHSFASIGEHIARSGPDMGPQAGGTHLAEIGLELTSGLDREISTDDVLKRWRELTGPVPDAIELSFSSDAFGAGDPISIELFGGSDLDEVTRAAATLKQHLATFAGVSDIADSFRLGKQEVQLSVRESALPLGLTQNDLARQVRQAFYGEEAQRVQRGRDDVRVMVRYPEAERRSLGSLEEMRIRSRDGVEVPFSAVAEAEITRGFASISRIDRTRVVTVSADVDRSLTTPEVVIGQFEEWVPEFESLHPSIRYRYGGEQREQADAASGLFGGIQLALVLIFVLLAIPLRSYGQPLIIMSVIPFGMVGAILGHKLMGWDVVFFSVLGMIALSGVVVNSSLVMVHAINSHRSEGFGLLDSVRRSAILRFRPIVLTTATTFIGLLPLMSEAAVPAVPLIPMAISLAFGVLYASIMTLFLVPLGYLILDDISNGTRRARERVSGRVNGPPLTSKSQGNARTAVTPAAE